jgi:hypothetical protein
MTAESTPVMHSDLAGTSLPVEVPCAWCGQRFKPRRGWSRFCTDQHRSDFHRAERRANAIRDAAPRMFEALQQIARGTESPVALAIAAIHDLKAPEPNPALTSLAETIAKVNADADRRDAALPPTP